MTSSSAHKHPAHPTKDGFNDVSPPGPRTELSVISSDRGFRGVPSVCGPSLHPSTPVWGRRPASAHAGCGPVTHTGARPGSPAASVGLQYLSVEADRAGPGRPSLGLRSREHRGDLHSGLRTAARPAPGWQPSTVLTSETPLPRTHAACHEPTEPRRLSVRRPLCPAGPTAPDGRVWALEASRYEKGSEAVESFAFALFQKL